MPNIPQFIIAFIAILKTGAWLSRLILYTAYGKLNTRRKILEWSISWSQVISNQLIKQAQPNTYIKKVIVTNLKEALPGLTKILFSLFVEKREGIGYS